MRSERREIAVLDIALWVLFAGLAGATVAASLAPDPPLPPDVSDKVAHATAYAALTGCWLLAAAWRPGRGAGRWPKSAPWFALTAVVAGTVLEVAQAAMPVDRAGNLADAAANTVGVAVAVLLWGALRSALGRGSGASSS